MIRRILNLYRFTRSEQRSIFLLCSVLLLVHGLNYLVKQEPNSDGSQFEHIEAQSSFLLPGKIPIVVQKAESEDIHKKEPQDKIIEINTSDSVKLLDLYGIGPVFAGRIIKYRNLLGGFRECTQPLEIYGMDTIRYNGFRSRISVNESELEKLDINTCGFKDLLRHPYLDYEAVKKLVGYRDNHGPMSSPAILWTDSILPVDLKNKLLPYLK